MEYRSHRFARGIPQHTTRYQMKGLKEWRDCWIELAAGVENKIKFIR